MPCAMMVGELCHVEGVHTGLLGCIFVQGGLPPALLHTAVKCSDSQALRMRQARQHGCYEVDEGAGQGIHDDLLGSMLLQDKT